MSRVIYVNEAYRPQRVSGQQRYATEVSDRLPADVRRMRPGKFWSSSRIRTWLWTQTVLPLRTFRGVLISLTSRAPVWHPRHLLVVHDLFVLEHPEWFSARFAATHRPLLRIQLATAQRLAAVSEPVAAQVRARRPTGAVVVAPNAPSAVFKHPAGREIHECRALSQFGLVSGCYLLVVGNRDPRKNLRRLAEAFGQLTQDERASVPLVVVGGEADVFRQADIVWPPETVLTGYVDDAVLHLLYANARAVVFPSLAEGFGLPIVEAVVAGTPRLLVSDIPVFRWICGDGASYVDPESVDNLAAALRPDRIGTIPRPDLTMIERFDWSHSTATISQAADRLARDE